MWFAGVLGIKVKIMLPWDPSGKIGPKRPLPDHVSILDPKDQPAPEQPYSEQKGAKPTDAAAMWDIITLIDWLIDCYTQSIDLTQLFALSRYCL